MTHVMTRPIRTHEQMEDEGIAWGEFHAGRGPRPTMEDLEHDGEDDPTKIREDVGTRIAPDVKVPEEVEESLRREREGEDQEEVHGG